ncbi:MAG TPA: Crp/Fnr family transcriptional regulator [Gammaproteobacteria bacterium]|nr:Crp/Fnr family transcriptional regulator [Gammaproteobacteria bacterium]
MKHTAKLPKELQLSCADCSTRRHAWFKHCNTKELNDLQEHRTAQHTLKAGDYLFMEGDTPGAAFTLQEGWVICFKSLSNGRRQILSVAFSGDYLGYQSDMSQPIDYSAMAVSDCRICSFNGPSIMHLLQKQPSLIQSLLEIQQQQAIACRTRLTYVGQAPAKQKLAYFLTNILAKLEQRGVDIRETIDFPLTHEDVADAIGITSVHMCRVAIELRRAGIVDCRHNHIRVTDFPALKALAQSVF